MKLSRLRSSLLIIIFLACGGVAAEPAYKGDIAAFKDFTAKYIKTDWPEPEIIGYFDPLGKTDAKVIRYAHCMPNKSVVSRGNKIYRIGF